MSNETQKPEAPQSQTEPSSANRRQFMKTVVTGTVAAGLVASVGKAEAAPTAAAVCGMPEKFPTGTPTSVKLLINRDVSMTLDRLWEIIHTTFEPSGCPNCGLGGIPNDPYGPYPIENITIERAFLSRDIDSMVVIQPTVAPATTK